MIKMHGTEATRHIRELGYKGLMLGLTGNVMTADIQEFQQCGLDHVMIKPFEISEFNKFAEKVVFPM